MKPLLFPVFSGSAALVLLLTSATAEVVCTETADTIVVTSGGRPVLTYHKSVREAPEGQDPVYRRSGYIHPVLNPDGQELTGDFPADHPHQHALFFAWRQVKFDGRQTDFWDQHTGRGRTSHEKVLSVKSGDDSGAFSVQILQEDLTAPGGPKPILREVWTVTVHARKEDESFFRFDLEQVQTNVADSPVVIEEYHYGGMAIRGHEQWLLNADDIAALKAWEKAKATNPAAPRPNLSRTVDFLTSEGKGRDDGNHTRPDWVDMHGTIDGREAGIAIFSAPTNFRHPQPVRLHPSKPYFCFSPMVLGEFAIDPGKTFSGRYRFIAHNGAPDPAFLDAEWREYAKRP